MAEGSSIQHKVPGFKTEVVIGRCQKHRALAGRWQGRPVLGQRDGQGALGLEPGGKGCGEVLVQVNDNQDGEREAGRQSAQNVAEEPRPPGGRCQGHQVAEPFLGFLRWLSRSSRRCAFGAPSCF